jgi:hypothetical protein
MQLTSAELIVCPIISDVCGISVEDVEEHLLIHKAANTYPLLLDSDRMSNIDGDVLAGKIITVKLTSVEMQLSNLIGAKRTKAARDKKYNNYRVSIRGDAFIETNGLSGELVSAKGHNLYPSEQLLIMPRPTKDDKGDVIHIIDGKPYTFDVKTTDYLNGHLALAAWKYSEDYTTRVQAFCLVLGDYTKGNDFMIAGHMTAERLIARKLGLLPYCKDLQYLADQSELVTFNDVCQELKSQAI